MQQLAAFDAAAPGLGDRRRQPELLRSLGAPHGVSSQQRLSFLREERVGHLVDAERVGSWRAAGRPACPSASAGVPSRAHSS